MGRILATFATFVVALFGMATAAHADQLQLTPLIADVMSPPPTPFKGADSAYHLVYELRLANSSPWNLELIDVATFSNGAFVFRLGDKELAKRFSIGGRRGAEKTTLTAGQFGVLFIHIGGLSENAVQTSIAHRIVVRRLDTGQDFTVIRYNPDGTLDPSFGYGGSNHVDFAGADDEGDSVAVQKDGRIVMSGVMNNGQDPVTNQEVALRLRSALPSTGSKPASTCDSSTAKSRIWQTSRATTFTASRFTPWPTEP